MSDHYSNESFNADSTFKTDPNDQTHNIKLSIDLHSVRNMTNSSNMFAAYQLQLQQPQSFQSSPPTAVNQNSGETQLTNTFSSYQFPASKAQLQQILNQGNLNVNLVHQDNNGQQTKIGTAVVPLNLILGAPLKQTPQAMVRVYEDWIDIKDSNQKLQGNLRVLMFLEDNGVAANQTTGQSFNAGGAPQSLQQARDSQRNRGNGSYNSMGHNPQLADANSQDPKDYQQVWQLEMWRRAEEAKFKAFLKQREIEKIEELTATWKGKEQEREGTFSDSLRSLETLENKLRQHALDLQKREERIIQLEEELKHKITEVSRQLASKEEEVLNIKKKFKEEKNNQETHQKRLEKTVEDLRAKLDNADNKFCNFKQEIEQSPLNVLRNELAQKSIDVVELETRVHMANEQKDDFKFKYEKVKKDLVSFKRQIDSEKEMQLTNQAAELENIKKQMRQNAQDQQEKNELTALRSQLQSLSGKLGETQQNQMQETQNSQQDKDINPFKTKNRYIDNYASGLPAGANQSLGTPHYQQFPGFNKPNANIGASRTGIPAGRKPLQTVKATGPRGDFERLTQERSQLVETGAYGNDDPLIIELDRSIKAAQLRVEQFNGTI